MFFKKFFCLSLVLSQATLAMDSLYSFDFDKLSAAEIAVKTTCSGQEAISFLELVPQASRSPISENFLEKKELEAAKNYARSFKQKGDLPLYKAQTIEEVESTLSDYYSNPGNLDQPEQAKQRLSVFRAYLSAEVDKAMEPIKVQVQKYNDYVAKMGTTRTWKFNEYLNRLLGIPQSYSKQPETESNEEKVFSALKFSGFLQTSIRSLKGYTYNPKMPILTYMEANPGISNIVLGCGHHLHTDVTNALNQPDECYCGMCNLTTTYHSKDFAISLMAADLPDVVADMHDERVWSMLQSKEGGWKRIADHSWSESLRQNSTLTHIYKSLSDGGIFEIWDIHPQEEIMAQLGPIGFKFVSQDEEKRLMFFTK